MAEGQESRDSYCPCCRHCNPVPESKDPLPRWLQPIIPREPVKLDSLKIKWKRW